MKKKMNEKEMNKITGGDIGAGENVQKAIEDAASKGIDICVTCATREDVDMSRQEIKRVREYKTVEPPAVTKNPTKKVTK